jgi:murein DD-endopeptidase MepM/ murein hydrolase activator NlpD
MHVKAILVLFSLTSILTLPAVAVPPAEAGEEDPLAAGRQATERFYAGEVAELWGAMTEEMHAGLGGEPALAAFRAQVAAQLGDETQVLSEDVSEAGGYMTYRRIARFEKSPAPVVVQFSFDGEGRIAGFYVRPVPEPAPSGHEGYETKADLRLPFEGEWTVVWGGRTPAENYHVVNAAQRFAYDLLVTRDGSSHRGESDGPEDFYCWGKKILAPAAGTVTEAVDGLPDQAPGELPEGLDVSEIAGNHVVIDHGEGEHSLLAHFQEGSVAVETGQKVERGQLLGLCGNSGNTTEPHLHYHLQTAPTFGEGVGLPAQFQGYTADGKPVERGEPRQGQVVASGGEGPGS